ncbi:DNA helicase [Halobacillus andaensis]|uniref:DNA helicase n=1 Tax=Halobacillus andaensis TaxID=1176239 RepID=A0A917B2U8_HALAA|nr:AAA family ATPase [Halobacillus andaensis]MBP2004912.1 superfamily I DNA and RNA helicase [Halobacillus andaensis]GGF17931.1 DNA helicase [Halobacillus andaensis]
MANSFYFQNLDEETLTDTRINEVLEELESYAEKEKKQVYVIDKPVSEKKYQYSYKKAIVVLVPQVKILIINFGEDSEEFDDFFNDFIEDLGYISDKYEYKSFLGRPRKWERDLIKSVSLETSDDIRSFIEENGLSGIEARKGELLISLLTGSINDIERVDGDVPTSTLEQIKRNIVLFDGEQTRFIFQHKNKDRVTIQGLAGTGKTELLLHKLKNIYVNEEDTKIFFTCFNKILAKNLKERIPDFFDFMKVGEQIKWNERLWVERSWGSQANRNSGVYSFICNHYGIPFQRYRWGLTFESVCKNALDKLNQLEEERSFEPFFDYMLIDESQDFNEAFFQLCEKVTKKQVYIAGDIFQNIYDYNSIAENKPDFLLNKVYRTDPKTLMFAHTVGFGLLERPVVRWLSDEEWEACGYNIEKEGEYYTFSREPLKRFENLDEDIISLQLSTAESDKYLDEVLWSLRDIKDKNPTVEAGDIGVVFLENHDKNYALAEELSIRIDQEFGWSSVKGYEVKAKGKDSLFISNRNNIKGLEFPFIVCITTTSLNTHTSIRNSLYMMLTRSFITSYLILSENNGDLNSKLEGAVETIMDTGKLEVKEPKPSEIMDKSKLMLEASGDKSQYEIVEDILLSFDIDDSKTKQKMHTLVNVMLKDSVDTDKIYTLINQNIGFI